MSEEAIEVLEPDLLSALGKRRMSVCDECDTLEGVEHPIEVIPKTSEQRVMLTSVARKALLFRHLSDTELDRLVDAMTFMKFEKGKRVLKQGFETENFYIVEKGSFEEVVLRSDGSKDHLATYEKGSFFGEIALMYGIQRTSTVRALRNGILWALGRNVFKQIVVRSAYQRRQSYETMLNSIPELSYLDDADKHRIADVLEMKQYKDGELIVTKGDPVDGIYFVISKMIQVKVTEPNNAELVVKMKMGEFLGEGSLFKNLPRLNTVHSVGVTEFAFLPKYSIDTLLLDCMEDMKKSSQTKFDRRTSGQPVALT